MFKLQTWNSSVDWTPFSIFSKKHCLSLSGNSNVNSPANTTANEHNVVMTAINWSLILEIYMIYTLVVLFKAIESVQNGQFNECDMCCQVFTGKDGDVALQFKGDNWDNKIYDIWYRPKATVQNVWHRKLQNTCCK